MFKSLFSKPKHILTEADFIELQKMEREAYMEEAKKLIVERGKAKAHAELDVKKKGDSLWQM